jgi:hypothetical protein
MKMASLRAKAEFAEEQVSECRKVHDRLCGLHCKALAALDAARKSGLGFAQLGKHREDVCVTNSKSQAAYAAWVKAVERLEAAKAAYEAAQDAEKTALSKKARSDGESFITMFHGLSAFKSTKAAGPVEIGRRARVCRDGAEVCGSDKAIGKIGLILSGHCTGLYQQDCWSAIKDGIRVPGDVVRRWIVPASQKEAEIFCKESLQEYESDYTESFIIGAAVSGIWVKSDADKKTRQIAEILARGHRCDVFVVEEDTRIWEVLDLFPPVYSF